MDHKKRRLSGEEDNGPGPAKRQKASETEHEKESSNPIDRVSHTPAFQSEATCTTNSEPESSESANACDKSLMNSKEELLQTHGNSGTIDAPKNGLAFSDAIVVSSSSSVIVSPGEPEYYTDLQVIRALVNTNQTLPCLATMKSQLEETTKLNNQQQQDTIHFNSVLLKQSVEVSNTIGKTETTSEEVPHHRGMIPVKDVKQERLKQISSEEVTHDSSEVPMMDDESKSLTEKCSEEVTLENTKIPMMGVESEKLKEICREELTNDINVIPVENDEPCQLKESINEDVTCDITEIPVVEYNQDKLEGEIDEKQNDKVSSPLTIEVSAVEESKLELQDEKITEITDSTLQNSDVALLSTQLDEYTKNEGQHAGK